MKKQAKKEVSVHFFYDGSLWTDSKPTSDKQHQTSNINQHGLDSKKNVQLSESRLIFQELSAARQRETLKTNSSVY